MSVYRTIGPLVIFVSSQALKFIGNFEIQDLDSLYTDGHALLHTLLQLKNIQRKTTETKNTFTKLPRPQ